jgi:hypothetical protein
MRDSQDELDSWFRTVNLIGVILLATVFEAFLLQRWRELEFLAVAPNFVLMAVLFVVMCRRLVRYLRAYFRESRLRNPSSPWYRRLRSNRPGESGQRVTVGSLVMVGLLALTWIVILIARSRI